MIRINNVKYFYIYTREENLSYPIFTYISWTRGRKYNGIDENSLIIWESSLNTTDISI